ncbi:hypothetical protein Tco_0888327 [Tanacetum coccineum]
MACSLSHIVDEIKAMVQKQIEEDKVRQLAIMNLDVEFENASIAKDDLRKAYDECSDIPQENGFQNKCDLHLTRNISPRHWSPLPESVYFVIPTNSPRDLVLVVRFSLTIESEIMVNDKKNDEASSSSGYADGLPLVTGITDSKLDGSNFFAWSKTVRTYLRSIGKASHLKDKPLTDETKDQWLQNDARLFLMIMNSIEPSVIPLLDHCEYVKELIDYLDFFYSRQKNISRIYSMCKAFHHGEQQHHSLTAYVMEFKKMYEELNSLLPISADVKVMQKQREQIAVMSFLTSLRPEFDSLRCQFLNETEIPSLQVKMDDPNITMEEYIRLEEEKARRRGKVFNWKTATYGKIWDNEDVHDLRFVETEFPAIVFNKTLTSESSTLV